MTVVEIHDKEWKNGESRGLAFDLADILSCIAPVRGDLKWAVLDNGGNRR